MRTGRLLIWVGLALLLPATAVLAGDDGEQDRDPPFVSGELLVRFNAGNAAADVAAFCQKHGLKEKADLGGRRPRRGPTVKLLSVPVWQTKVLMQGLRRDPRVRYAEFNYLLFACVTPNDPQFNQLWGLHNTGQTGGTTDADIDAPEAWNVTTGSASVLVGVIDSGVDYNHPDLNTNMWTNPGEIAGNGVDDDGNGYVDDIHGINAITNTGNPMDDYFHGTHVAGTIGARGNNGTGVVGVNWNVSIVACKFLSSNGSGSTSNAIQCFQYLNYLKNVQGRNVVITSNSWGGGGYSQALRDAMQGLDQPGMAPLFHACAAGNNNRNNDPRAYYPASYTLSNIVSVAATDASDLYASFSSWGSASVDIAAPGVSIYSTRPGNTYGNLNGTSMATPHVAGTAALVHAQFPGLSAAQVKQRILFGVDPIGNRGNNGSKPTLTSGRLNALNALQFDTTPPAAVDDLTVSSATWQSVTLGWTATDDSGAAAAAYDVRYSTALITDANWGAATAATGEPAPQSPGATETFTISGLESGTLYFALKVLDAVGNQSSLSNVASGSTTGVVLFQDDMESGSSKWTTSSTTGNGNWAIITTANATSPTRAWFSSDVGSRKDDRLDLANPVMIPAGGAVLEFSHVYGMESRYDGCVLEGSFDGGAFQDLGANIITGGYTGTISTGWSNPIAGRQAWTGTGGPTLVTVDLSPYGGSSAVIRFRLGCDTIVGADGWYVDDVKIIGAGAATEPPAADAGDDQSGDEGDTFSFDGSGSSNGEGTIVAYAWNFGDGGTANGVEATHVYTDNGAFTVTLTVTDDLGATDMDTAVVTVANVAPTAGTDGPQSGDEGSALAFNATVSDPGSSDTHDFSWDFGDGGTGSGPTVSHTYADNGAYTVTVTVTDDDGDSDAAQTAATVANVVPTADAGGPYAGVAGTAMPCSGGVSDPGSADTHTFSWDFGDGGSGTGRTPTHTYAAAGSYTVTLTVTDDDGDSDTDSATANVSEPGQGGDHETIASDGFESRNYSGGSGAWAGAWQAQGDVRISSWGGAHSGTAYALLRRSTGQLQRTVSLAGATGVSLRFWARVRSFEGSDQALVLVSPDGVNFTPVKTFGAADSDNTYHFYEIDLSGFAMTDTFVIRFDAEMSGRRDYLYVDDVEVYGVAGD